MTDDPNLPTRSRLRRRALWAAGLCYVAAALTVAGLGWVALNRDGLAQALSCQANAVIAISPSAHIWVWLASLPPALCFIAALWGLAACFRRIASGRVMVMENAIALARTGTLFAFSAVLAIVSRTVAVLAATLSNPPGERMLTIGFGTPDMMGLTTGAAFLAMGLVMREAVRLADDNAGFV